MTPELAKSYFHGADGYNCAQAILKAFQTKYHLSQADIDAHKESGGGKVAGGTCGALYAAQLLAGTSQQHAVERHFQQQAKHTTCEKIKDKTISCQECVAAAATALSKWA